MRSVSNGMENDMIDKDEKIILSGEQGAALGSVMSTSPVRICLAITKKPIHVLSRGGMWIGCRLIRKRMPIMREVEKLK